MPQLGDHPHQWFGSRTYAQHGDDLVLLNVFHHLGIKMPTYIDVGAYHPYHLSNTALLYEKGCRGINVEANPDLMEAFHQERPDDKNMNVGVATISGTMPFYRADASNGRNSFLRSAVEPLGISSVIEVPVVTLGMIIEISGHVPDLLSLDIEGLDLPVLQSLDWSKYAPRVIIVEAQAIGLEYQGDAIYRLLADQKYALAFRPGNNMVFVR